jgi:hypothetical protein
MRRPRIPRALRERVAAQGQHRCSYCLLSEAIVGLPLDVDHIMPVALGGLTTEDNLCLACSACNARKGDRIEARDPLDGGIAPLFHPRQQRWHEHLVWSTDGERILGLTPTGRATVRALDLNRPLLVAARRRWVAAGWHPPTT